MDQEVQMPSARMVAEAMATVLAGKLADQAEGIAESLAHEAGQAD